MVLPKICTIGSHSALQILKGAKDEDFSTVVIAIKGREKPYEFFKVADETIVLDSYNDFFKIEEELIKNNCVIIPHASFIEYIGYKKIEKLRLPYFGNKKILKWESDRGLQREWLKKAGLRLPEIFKKPEDIDRLVIVKFHGAKGGKGYFLAKNVDDYNKKIKHYPNEKPVIQEYIIGVPIYIHYFYSSLTDELEIMSFDKRYESNVDSIGRISARDQMALKNVDPSYVVVGNVPIVIRESLLSEVIEMGEKVIKESKKIAKPGLFGPFCLETVVTPEQEFFVFEISARIVAGTNPFVPYSPYSYYKYDGPMSTGRRIAREIKIAFKQNKMDKILQ